MKKRECRLGLDLGRVITDGSMEDMMRDLRRGRKDFRRVSHVGGVFKGVAQLVKRWFGQEVRIISVCDPELGEKLIEWLVANVFLRRTGLEWKISALAQYVRFCARYADKIPIAREFRITHFVDDRPEVLIPMKGIVRYRFLFNPEPEVLAEFKGQLVGITIVWNWKELVAAIGATMKDAQRRASHGRRKNNALRRRKVHSR